MTGQVLSAVSHTVARETQERVGWAKLFARGCTLLHKGGRNAPPPLRENATNLFGYGTGRRSPALAAALLLTVVGAARAVSPFATRVLDYSPAPGQFVNDPAYNDPSNALGPPEGAGISHGNETSVVSLGGFGGSITLGFDHTIENDPLNPLGMDFIVFGNAFWLGGDNQRHFAECAVVEVSRDSNGNGLPDDEWYLIRGTYLSDPLGQFAVKTWDDDTGDPTYPPALDTWVPPGRTGVWWTAGFELPLGTFAPALQVINNPSADPTREGIVGYAEYTPVLFLGDLDGDDVVDDPGMTPEAFYTVPDDPFRAGITPGSGGGDAFDISWATERFTGKRVNLTGINFIRVTTAVDALQGVLGEVSAEVDAVADVAAAPPDATVPVASTWGLVVTAIGVLIAATVMIESPGRKGGVRP